MANIFLVRTMYGLEIYRYLVELIHFIHPTKKMNDFMW